jgi:hypothetical protein
MVTLNDKKFVWMLLAGIMSITGMLIKNGYESTYLDLPFIDIGSYKAGGWLCILSIFIAALSIATNGNSYSIFDLRSDGYGALAMFAAALILIFGSKLKQYQSVDQKVDMRCPDYIIAGFSGGWALLALSIAVQSGWGWLNTGLAFSGVLMMITAKLGVLPYQRRILQVDGPGYSLITAGWLSLAFANGL